MPERERRQHRQGRLRSRLILQVFAFLALAASGAAQAGPGPIGAGAASAQRPADVQDPAGLIAYVTRSGHVAVVDPDTGEATELGAGSQRAIFPAWSSDGNRIAAVVATAVGTQVEVYDVARGLAPAVVLAERGLNPIYLNWSPDDTHLAVLSSSAGSALALDIIRVEDALAGRPDARVTLGLGQPFYWVWSRTGRSVLVHQNVLREDALAGMTRIDRLEVTAPLASPGAFQSPDISDSESYIAYAADDARGSRVVVASNPARSAAATPVVELAHEGLVAFAWRPGHDQLSVQGATTSGYFDGPVEVLDVPSGESRVITADMVLASFWSPDGRWLATISQGDGVEREARPGSEAILVAARGPAAGQLWNVQSRPPLLRLRFHDVDDGTYVEGGPFRPSPAFLTQYLPFFDQYSRSHSLWAPDSSAIVLPTFQEAEGTLLVVYGVDGSLLDLVPGDMPAWNVR